MSVGALFDEMQSESSLMIAPPSHCHECCFFGSLHCDEIITPQDENKYHMNRLCWNRAINAFPMAIAYCKTVEQVSNCIAFARENQLPIRIRSGGHSYEGFSTGDNVLIIDVSRFKNIDLDLSKMQAKIGSGVQNTELFNGLKEHGLIAVGGACPTVGVVGFAMGGGWSFGSREFGLGCDSIVEFEMVDYDGNLITVNEETHPELFWACRGAGAGNFGICVSMTLKVYKNYDRATLITLNCPNCCEMKIVSKIKAWQEFFKTCDTRFNGKINVYNCSKDGIGFNFLMVFFGSAEEASILVQPLLDHCRPDYDRCQVTNPDSSIDVSITESSVFNTYKTICDIHPDFESFKSTGGFMSRDLEMEEVTKFIEIVKNKARGCIYTAFSLFGLGGAIKNVPNHSTAFPYRDAQHILSFQTLWEESEYAQENKEWLVEKIFKHVLPITDGMFVNFPLIELKDYREQYYGKEVWRQEKLSRVKKQYDPLCVFTHSHGINK